MSYYPIIKKQHKTLNKPQWYVFQEGVYYKIKRSQAMNEFFPQLLFYRATTPDTPNIDDESDGETNYYIKNSLYTRNAYQQVNPM